MDSTGAPRRREERTVADRLRQARRRRFVGRLGELELFRAAVAEPEPSFVVLFLHGPGGVGKTALLDALADVAEEGGVTPVRVDARTVEASPHGFRTALGAALGLTEGEDPTAALAAGGRQVLMLDTYELLAPTDRWVRERFLPELPGEVLVVIAGRNPPPAAWVADPGWRELLRVVGLRNLRPEDARAYLRAEGVPEGLHERVLAATHGHPLALALLVDVVRQQDHDNGLRDHDGRGDGAGVELDAAPDVVRLLLERFVDEVPTPRHREALEVCAHAPFTTQELLRDVLGDDAGELLGWLRRLSVTEESPAGVSLHDLAREVLDADLRWRDQAAHDRLHRRVQAHLLRRIREREGVAQQRALTEMVLFQRWNPRLSPYWDWASLGRHYADVLRPGDREVVVAMTERHQGRASAALVEHWLDRQPGAFVVVRGQDEEPVGFGALLRLHEATSQDLAGDPGAGAMWEYAQRRGPPRPGEEVTALRFVIDRDAYQQPSASFNVVMIHQVLHVLRSTHLVWDFFGAYEDADRLAPFFTSLGYHRAPEADYTVAGRHYQGFACDWRHLSVQDWLDAACQGKLGGEDGSTTPPAPVLALSQPEFADAVRQGLRDLHRPDALGRNPLLRSRLVRDRAGEEAPTVVLVGLLQEAAAALGSDPRTERLRRAVDRTYLRPAPTQERAAELLDLPFSTYRRHLTAGVRRITELLWHQELYGATEQKLNSGRSGD